MGTEYRWKDMLKTLPTWRLVTSEGKMPYFKGAQIEAVVVQDLGAERFFWKVQLKGNAPAARSGHSKTKEEAFEVVEEHLLKMQDSGEFFGRRAEQKMAFRPFPGRPSLDELK